MLYDPRWRACAIFAPMCAVVGAIVGLVVVPAYIHWDLIRQCGGHPFPPTLGRKDVLMFTSFLCGGGLLILGPALIFAPAHTWGRWRQAIALGVSLPYPWGILVLVALLMTPPDGLWYRCFLNAAAFLSLPVINWGLALASLKLLQKARWFSSTRSGLGT